MENAAGTRTPAPRPNGVAVLCVAAALAFLLPFGTVSCDDETVEFTGLELATAQVAPDGGGPQTEDGLETDVEIEASPYALAALVFAVGGLASALLRHRGGGFALASFLCLLVLLLEGSTSLATVSIHLGFFLALGSTLAASSVALFGWLQARARRRSTGLPRPAFWPRFRRPVTFALPLGAIGAVVVVQLFTAGVAS